MERAPSTVDSVKAQFVDLQCGPYEVMVRKLGYAVASGSAEVLDADATLELVLKNGAGVGPRGCCSFGLGKAYPNPVGKMLNVTMLGDYARYAVINAVGRVLQEVRVTGEYLTLNASCLPRGVLRGASVG